MRGTLFNRKKKFEHWELIALYLVAYDIVAVNFAYFFGLWLRFDLQFSHIPQDYLSSFLQFTPVYTIFSIIVFYRLRLYKSLWRFASLSELNRIVCASAITSLFQIVGITIFFQKMPVSYYLIGAALQFAAVVGVRFSYRYIILLRKKKKQTGENVRNAMVIGAGAAGQIIIKELKNSSETRAVPCCIIDDNSNKWGRFMYNVPIVGGRDSIMENVKKYHIDEILFAIPTARPEERRDI